MDLNTSIVQPATFFATSYLYHHWYMLMFFSFIGIILIGTIFENMLLIAFGIKGVRSFFLTL